MNKQTENEQAVENESTETILASRGSAPATRAVLEGSFRVVNRVVEVMTSERFQLINLTEKVGEIVRRSGIREGLVHLQSLHTTAVLVLCEWQQALLNDLEKFLWQLVPSGQYWQHNDPEFSDCDRKNAEAHLRGVLLSQFVTLQVRNARLLLGTWQNILLVELDGPRNRSVAVQVSGIAS